MDLPPRVLHPNTGDREIRILLNKSEGLQEVYRALHMYVMAS